MANEQYPTSTKIYINIIKNNNIPVNIGYFMLAMHCSDLFDCNGFFYKNIKL